MKKKLIPIIAIALLMSVASCNNGGGSAPEVKVQSIELQSTTEEGDVYVLTYSDNTTVNFVVIVGDNGVSIRVEPDDSGKTHVIYVGENGNWFVDDVDTGIKAQIIQGQPGKDGTSVLTGHGVPSNNYGKDGDSYVDLDTWDYYVKVNGGWVKTGNIKGGEGRSIISIAKTDTTGNVDTYTITYSDGSTTTFTITNGEDGTQGIQGQPGENGHTPTITIGLNGNWWIDGYDTGIKAQGPQGEQGVSITSIAKTSSSGNVDTYTITYSNGSTTTFTVTNGTNGEQGIQGVPGADGHTPIITIGINGNWYVDGTDTGIKAQGPQGPQGEQGVSIVSIEKTSSSGNVDIYTIKYSNGTSTTFTVTNGADGSQGIQGVPGEDGHTPVITIGANGNWMIDSFDTGIKAQGPQGQPGADGTSVITGNGVPTASLGKDGDSYIDLNTWDYYVKVNNAWLKVGNIKGGSGPQGVGIVSIEKTSTDGNVDTYTITYSDGSTSTFTITNGQDGHDGNTPYIGENGNWWIDGVDTGVNAGADSTDNRVYELSDFQNATEQSKPTRVVMNQTFTLPNVGLTLHYASNLTVEYDDEVRSRYDYTYEKLNEIVTGNESFMSVVSGTLYSRGASVYDGVQWVNKADKTATMSGVNLSVGQNEDVDKNVLRGSIDDDEKIKDFFGVDYKGIKDFSYVITLHAGQLASVRLEFKCKVEEFDEYADVVNYTTFSYEHYTVNIPE